MSDDNMQMDEMEYLRAKFFAPEGEIERVQAERDARKQARRDRYKANAEFRLMRRVVKVFNELPHSNVTAWINWLDEAYKSKA